MTALTVEQVALDALAHDPDNARRHSQQNLAAIGRSLNEFGQRRPLVVRGNVVIAGNGTLEAARALGWDTITITRVPEEWTLEQAKAYAIADNRTAELATWDHEALLSSLSEFDHSLLSAAGFDPTDVDNLSRLTAAPNLDDLFEDIGEPTAEDNMTRVSFLVPVEVAAKWEFAVKSAGSGSELENLCTTIHAAYEAIVDGV